jgi:hypothetical protein
MIRTFGVILAVITFVACGCSGRTQVSSTAGTLPGTLTAAVSSTAYNTSGSPVPPATSKPDAASLMTTTAAPVAMSTTASATATGTADILRVMSARMFSNTSMSEIIILSDMYGNVYNFEGTVSAYIWQNVDIAMFGKGDLLQKWEGVAVSKSDHFENDIGKYLVFNFYGGFAPRAVQSVYLDLTLVTGGRTLKWEGEMPLTMSADCPCQTQDVPPWEG